MLKPHEIISQMTAAQQRYAGGIHTCLGTNMLGYAGVKRLVLLCCEMLFPGYFGDPLRQKQNVEQSTNCCWATPCHQKIDPRR